MECGIIECNGQPTYTAVIVLVFAVVCLMVATADIWYRR